MKRRTHLALGMLSSVIVFLFSISMNLKTELPFGDLILIGAFFGILPDIDIFIRKHRGPLTHSLMTSIVVFLSIIILSIINFDNIFSNLLTWDCAAVASIAIFSHTIADSLTPLGVPLYYPLNKRKNFHFPLIGGRLKYDNSFANKIIEISSISILIIVLISGAAIEFNLSPDNSIRLIKDILNYFY